MGRTRPPCFLALISRSTCSLFRARGRPARTPRRTAARSFGPRGPGRSCPPRPTGDRKRAGVARTRAASSAPSRRARASGQLGVERSSRSRRAAAHWKARAGIAAIERPPVAASSEHATDPTVLRNYRHVRPAQSARPRYSMWGSCRHRRPFVRARRIRGGSNVARLHAPSTRRPSAAVRRRPPQDGPSILRPITPAPAARQSRNCRRARPVKSGRGCSLESLDRAAPRSRPPASRPLTLVDVAANTVSSTWRLGSVRSQRLDRRISRTSRWPGHRPDGVVAGGGADTGTSRERRKGPAGRGRSTFVGRASRAIGSAAGACRSIGRTAYLPAALRRGAG